jgi:hypothetical protein
MALKNPVTLPGIDLGTVRLVAQREIDGLPAEICQFRCCIPWIEKFKHDPGVERGLQNA